MIVRDNEKACNRSYACLLFRLPPSDLHTQQAQNSPRLMSVNLLPSCPRVLKIGGIQKEENKSIKAQYLKKYRTETLGLKIEVYHLVLSLYRGKAILGMAQSFCVSFLCNVCFLFTLF